MSEDESSAERPVLEEVRLRALREEVARVMRALDELGLHQAAAHASMSLHAIDVASDEAGAPAGTWLN